MNAPDPLPWHIPKSEFFRQVGTSNGKRALFHKLVTITQQGGKGGGRETMIDTESGHAFYVKWIQSGKGDQVPRLPSERPPRQSDN